jgi:hypothetical protein
LTQSTKSIFSPENKAALIDSLSWVLTEFWSTN